LQRIGFTAGANPGKQLADALGLPTSATTLRRRIREAPDPIYPPVRVLGVDDWAWRKGQRYGTILCDLERGRIIDLLPDRSADSLAKWLQERPGIDIISRDRASCYAEGARKGAPNAKQVADRWHILKNMTETIEKVLNRKRQLLKEAAKSVQASTQEKPEAETNATKPGKAPSSISLRSSRAECIQQDCKDTVAPIAPVAETASIAATAETVPVEQASDLPRKPASRAQQASANRREARLERYNKVVQLSQDGLSMRSIARQMGIRPVTVKKYLSAGEFPEMAPRIRASRLDSYLHFIQKRLADGPITGADLYKELQQQGFNGSYSAVRRYLQEHRQSTTQRKRADVVLKKQFVSPRPVSMMIMMQEQKREKTESDFLIHLRGLCPEIEQAAKLATDFAAMVRERKGEKLDEWLARVEKASVPEITAFAEVLNRDRDAVIAGLTLSWNNGATEGHVNRLKTIKRQMYGRAGFEMLRKRVLIPP
jgi:transposase